MEQFHEKSTIFSLYYSRELDRFDLVDRVAAGDDDDEDPETNEDIDFAELILDQNPADYILFDNDDPGRVLKATHEAGNKRAVELLSRTVLGPMYALVCECFREGAHIYDERERTRTLIVPATSARKMAGLALHASASYVSDEVKLLYYKISGLDALTGGGDGEVPQPLI